MSDRITFSVPVGTTIIEMRIVSKKLSMEIPEALYMIRSLTWAIDFARGEELKQKLDKAYGELK